MEDYADLPADEIAPRPDTDGHSVVTLRLGHVPKSAFGDRDRYLRWRLCMQEAGLRSLGLGRGGEHARPGYVYVLDCTGLKAFHVSKPARRCATDFAQVMMDFYPDCAPRAPLQHTHTRARARARTRLLAFRCGPACSPSRPRRLGVGASVAGAASMP